MKNSINNFTKSLLVAGCVSLGACSGGSDASYNSPEIKANAAATYYVELNSIKSLVVSGKKIKFERYDVCESEHKVSCYPAVLIYQSDDKLVYKHLAEDRQDLKVSLVTLEQYAIAKTKSNITGDSFNVVLNEIKKPLTQLNSLYLSRCRFVKEWQAMTELATQDRKVLYVQFSPSELRPDLLFRFDTESGAVEVFKTQIRNASSKQEDPFLMISVRNEAGDLAVDNALMSFYAHGERCNSIYRHFKPTDYKRSEDLDKDASAAMDYIYDTEERLSEESNVPFLGASTTKALMPPYLEAIYPEDQTY